MANGNGSDRDGGSARHNDLPGALGVWSARRGTVKAWNPTPGVLVTLGVGHLDLELAEHIIDSGDHVLAHAPRLIAFHDWEEVPTYDSNARAALTSWGVRIRDRVERVHILVKSRLVKMGVSVASIVLVGMLVSHKDRAAFDRELRKTMLARGR